jgi:hypothetical protein
MKCCYCESELVKDSFGFLCPNEKCNSIDGINKFAVYANGNKEWYKNDKLHRENGPAMECLNGKKVWYKDGIVHREDGPAIEYPNGGKLWYKNGQRCSENG